MSNSPPSWAGSRAQREHQIEVGESVYFVFLRLGPVSTLPCFVETCPHNNGRRTGTLWCGVGYSGLSKAALDFRDLDGATLIYVAARQLGPVSMFVYIAGRAYRTATRHFYFTPWPHSVSL